MREMLAALLAAAAVGVARGNLCEDPEPVVTAADCVGGHRGVHSSGYGFCYFREVTTFAAAQAKCEEKGLRVVKPACKAKWDALSWASAFFGRAQDFAWIDLRCTAADEPPYLCKTDYDAWKWNGPGADCLGGLDETYNGFGKDQSGAIRGQHPQLHEACAHVWLKAGKEEWAPAQCSSPYAYSIVCEAYELPSPSGPGCGDSRLGGGTTASPTTSPTVSPTTAPTVAPVSLPPGQWELVFRQTAESGDGWFRSEDEWVVNADDPASAQYSVLDTLDDYRGDDCKLTLRLAWPGATHALSGDLAWRQLSNPVRAERCAAVEGYEALDVSFTPMTTGNCRWGGLQSPCKIADANRALLDGCVGDTPWWFSVGVLSPGYQGGMPAVFADEGNFVADVVELYAYREDASSCPTREPTTAPTRAPSLAMATPGECLEGFVDIDFSIGGISQNNLGGVAGNCKKAGMKGKPACTAQGQVLRFTRVATYRAVWKSTTGLAPPHQTSELSISVKSKSIQLILGRIDCSHRVFEAQQKASRRNGRIRAH